MTSATRIGALALLLAGVFVLASRDAGAQMVDDVYPREPEDRATVGDKPVFSVGVHGTDLFKIKFKIELSRDDFETIAYTFDQIEDPGAWAYTALKDSDPESGAVLWLNKSLEEGSYLWRAYAWNGLAWIPGKDEWELYVDRTPPAPVEGIRMGIDRDRGAIILDWDPVLLDEKGNGENVVRYHIYRYVHRSRFLGMRMFRVGVTEDTHFEDTDPRVAEIPLLFYKITGEDVAGNETDRFQLVVVESPDGNR